MTEFVCEVEEEYRSACEGLAFYGEHEDKRYCVLHYPGEDKEEEFTKVLEEDKFKEEDYDFRGAIFPEGTSAFPGFEFDADVDLSGATFRGVADFSSAQFSGDATYFSDAKFSGTKTHFKEARFSSKVTYFSRAKFSGETIDFFGAQFNGARTHFPKAKFSGTKTDFSHARFGSSVDTNFRDTTFENEVTFTEAIFRHNVAFWGNKGNPVFGPEAWARFNHCHIEKPELLTFNTVLLHPGWFINADVRKVDFTDVKWYGMPGGPEGKIEADVRALAQRGVESPYTLLSQACRRLSANAEEKREYPLANEFHYWSMDATRKGDWSFFEYLTWRDLLKRRSWPTIARHFGLITTLYWALSGYGVRAARAFWILVSLWVVFAALYLLIVESSPFLIFSAADIWQGIDYARQAAVYSLSALVRLNPRPQSGTLDWFQTLVTIEGILGPIQIALLALAIRRKVMR
jgi:uncharacterized protein YjbI with pentapeptide repeats